MQIFPRTVISGTSFEIGEQLGRLSRTVLEKCLSDSLYAQQARTWKETYPLAELMELSARHFPDCWKELEGISAGCKIDIDDIYLWNCRPDLAKNAYDDSTSIAVNRMANRFIVQDILEPAALRSHCHIVEAKTSGGPSYLALYTPGMLPGISFSTSRAGLVQSVNLLDTPARQSGVPSAIIARGILQCGSLLEALEILMSAPRMGSTHHILAWAGEFVMLSVEATANKVSVVPISNKYAHTNHLLHAEQANQKQEPNVSSRKRYASLIEQLRLLADHPAKDDIDAWIRNGYGNLQQDARSSNPEGAPLGITVLFRCVSKKISVQLFNADRTLTQRFSFSKTDPESS